MRQTADFGVNITKKNINDFEKSLKQSLSCQNKYIEHKFVYDKQGDSFFEQLMSNPKYYLAKEELDILSEYKEKIVNSILNSKSGIFSLVDLGAGSGEKTEVLIKYLIERSIDFHFLPIDFSGTSLMNLRSRLGIKYKNLKINTINNTYLEGLGIIKKKYPIPSLVFFLGSNIGNIEGIEILNFCKELRNYLNKNDSVVIGFDMKKDSEIISGAYNCKESRQLIMNLIDRMNRELGIFIEKENFDYSNYYDSSQGVVYHYLVSNTNQNIRIEKIELNLNLNKGEKIHVGHSKKFTLEEISLLAHQSGFCLVENLMSKEGFFVSSLWKPC